MEAWAKSNPRSTTNRRGGYNTVCPVPTHRSPSQRLAVWDDGDGEIGLWCYSRCTPQKLLEAIAKAIKINGPPDTEPPFVQAQTAPQLEALEQEWAAADVQRTAAQLEQERAARQKAEDERDQERAAREAAETERDQARDDAKEVETLKEEKSRLEKQRDDAEKERDKAHDAREAAEAERKQEHDAREAAEARTSQLEAQLENNLVPATSKDAEIKKLRSRIKGLRGGAARTRLEERAKNEGCIENLKQKLADTTGQHSQELAARDSRINKIGEELDESRRKVLTFDFLETWCSLEKKLKSLNRELIQDGQRTVVANQLRRAYEKGSINDQQLMNLDNMRAQRDDVVHNALLLTTSQARAHLGILKQVIDQL